MKKRVATHNKIFHADEVTAVALLEIFTEDEIVVKRVAHGTQELNEFDMLIDIGQIFDSVKCFDHHQYKGGKSSAGLIWEYIGLEKEYPKISKLIKIVDDNDTGITKAKPFEYASLIKCFNSHNICGEEQDKSFTKAVEFAKTVLGSLKRVEDDVKNAKNIVANSFLFDGNPKILELNEFTPHWSSYVNGDLTPLVKAVVWADEVDNNYKVKIIPKRVGSFELNAKPLKTDKNMEFVHSAGFFAVAKDRDSMIQYLRRSI